MSVWTTKLRGPALGLTLASALMIGAPLHAAEGVKKGGSKQESIGVVSGMTVGALAGGPFGAVIGAAAGALMGDHYHKQLEDQKALAADLSQTQAARTRLQGDLVLTQEQSEKLGVAVDRSRDLEASIGFRTNDSVPSDEDVVRLQKLGALASAVGNVKVRVSGYADPRGSEKVNAALSERRADSVAHVLVQAGVDPTRLIVESHGEADSKAIDGDLDGYAFERRVTVKIESDSGDTAVAKN
jgi:outer membrane protein OmpA-like peptidoglycan-associated protein